MSNKRQNIFGQGGRDGNNYRTETTRDEDDPPLRATSAQLAARKIRSMPKKRLPPTASGGGVQTPQANPFASFNPTPTEQTTPSQPDLFASANFQSSKPPGSFGNLASAPPAPFNNLFGSSSTTQPAPASSNPFALGAPQQENSQQTGSFAFGSTNFQTSQPANPFTSTQQPAPQSGFSFSFGGNSAPQQQEPAAPATANPFGSFSFGKSSAPSQEMTTTTADTNSSTFGAIGTPQQQTPTTQAAYNFFASGGNLSPYQETPHSKATTDFFFGSTGGQQQPTTSTASSAFTSFGATSGQQQAATPATSSALTGFGATSGPWQPATTTASSVFANFSATSGLGQPTTSTASSAFTGFGATSAPTQQLPASTVSSGVFGFGTSAPPQQSETSLAPTNLFGVSTTTAPQQEVSTTAAGTAFGQPLGQMSGFGGFGNTSQQTPFTSLNFGQSAKTPVPTKSSAESTESTVHQQDRSNQLQQPPSIVGFGSNVHETSELAEQAVTNTSHVPWSSLGQPLFSTPKQSAPSPAPIGPPSENTARFGNILKDYIARTQSAEAASTPAPAASPAVLAQDATPTPAESPLSVLPSGANGAQATPRSAPALATAATPFQQIQAATAIPNETFGAPTGELEMSKVPKLFASGSWKASSFTMPYSANLDDITRQITIVAAALADLNQKFKDKIDNATIVADWSDLSMWHYKQSVELGKKLILLKKQRAAAKGITGHESSLSAKRKPDEEPETPSKKARGNSAFGHLPETSQPSAASSTDPSNKQLDFSRAAPSQSSTMLGDILGKSAAASVESDAGTNPKTQNIFGFGTSSSSTPAKNNSPFIPNTSSSAFGPITTNVPATDIGSIGNQVSNPFGNAFAKNSVKEAPQSTSQTPIFGFGATPAKSSAENASLQIPQFGSANISSSPAPASSTAGGSTNFLSQFASAAKTAEELAAERKKKAKDEDFDSDDETYEEWSARYDEEERKKKAKEDDEKRSAPSFSVSATSSLSNGEAPAPKHPFSFQNAASGTSSPAFVGSRVGSPASVFDAPQAGSTSASNIFGHLSSGPSSNNQDESSDEDDVEQTAKRSSSKRSRSAQPEEADADGSESEDTLEHAMKRKKQDTVSTKPSLASRMTRDNSGVSTPKSDISENQALFAPSATANGVSTPSKTPFSFFNFENAGSNTAPAKSSAFAGDQTFKPGTPIKFGTPDAETQGAPKFNFQPASPSPFTGSPQSVVNNNMSDKPSFAFLSNATAAATGPKPFSAFSAGAAAAAPSLLNPNAGQSGASGTSSVFSSRAPTPMSEQETSAQESANEDTTEEKSAQLDLTSLTDAEKQEHDILFDASSAIVKKQIKEPVKKWENVARGPLWILKVKATGKALVRVRLPNGSTPVNYFILPKIDVKTTGKSNKMVTAPYSENGVLNHYLFAFQDTEVAEEFCKAFNAAKPAK